MRALVVLVSMFSALLAFGSIASQMLAPVLEAPRELAPGHGIAVVQGDLATVDFIVRLQSGKEIANTIKRGLPYTIQIADSDPLFSAAIKGMRLAGEREVQIIFPEPGIPGIAPASVPIKIWIRLIDLKPAAGPGPGR